MIVDRTQDETNFIYTQSLPASLWVIEHNLKCYPSVTIVDSGGTIVEGCVRYESINTVIAEFAVNFSGQAFLR